MGVFASNLEGSKTAAAQRADDLARLEQEARAARERWALGDVGALAEAELLERAVERAAIEARRSTMTKPELDAAIVAAVEAQAVKDAAGGEEDTDDGSR